MPEQLSQGLSPEDNETAEYLYSRHKEFGKSLVAALEVNNRADEARRVVKEARSNGTIDDVTYEKRVFANGEIEQRLMLNHARLFYDANLWQAHTHKEEHLDEYIQQAKQEDIERTSVRS